MHLVQCHLHQQPPTSRKLKAALISVLRILPLLLTAQLLFRRPFLYFLSRSSEKQIQGNIEYSFQDGDTNTPINFLSQLRMMYDKYLPVLLIRITVWPEYSLDILLIQCFFSSDLVQLWFSPDCCSTPHLLFPVGICSSMLSHLCWVLESQISVIQ